MVHEYIKILQKALGIKWKSKVFDVHHINHNREDNSVENLVLLPRKLHRQYHYYFNNCSNPTDTGNLLNKKVDQYLPGNYKNIVELAERKSDIAIMYQAQREMIQNRQLFGEEFDNAVYFNNSVGCVLRKYL